MMQDVNIYEDYTFSVSDENWLKFCEFFNECVMDYGSITKELHYFRLKLNRTPDSFKELVDNKDNWYLYDKSHTAYHMNDSIKNDDFTSSNPKYPDCKDLKNNIYNMKLVDKYGMNEVVVTPIDINSDLTKPENWQILTDDYDKAKNNPSFKYDPINVGTYNYSAFDFDYVNLDGTIKKSSSSKHNKYDVYPYLGGKSKYSNWGNVPGMIYRNTKKDRDNNKNLYEDEILKPNGGEDKIYNYWDVMIND